ncbi:MAG: phosphate transport system substrate-binding protein [Verrucomicrobiales bacterium]|jgi:phosphate transport system substrate-binding protein
MRSLSLVFTLAILALLTGCGNTGGERRKISLTGSSTIAPLISEVAKRFEKANPDVRIDVQTGGSSRGIADVGIGTVEIGMSSRDLKDSEKQGRVAHAIAYDGVCFLVHASNPVSELSDEQIVGIYTGKIRNWAEVGGKNHPVTCINRAEGRSELELFGEFFGVQTTDIEADIVSGENQHGIKTVATDPNAIIFMSLGASEFEAGNGAKIKLLSLRGVAATSENVQSGKYPWARPLLLVTKLNTGELVDQFMAYAKSEEVNDLVHSQFYVPVQ